MQANRIVVVAVVALLFGCQEGKPECRHDACKYGNVMLAVDEIEDGGIRIRAMGEQDTSIVNILSSGDVQFVHGQWSRSPWGKKQRFYAFYGDGSLVPSPNTLAMCATIGELDEKLRELDELHPMKRKLKRAMDAAAPLNSIKNDDKDCAKISKAMVDSVHRADMEWRQSHVDAYVEFGPLGDFLLQLQMSPSECAIQQLSQTFGFLGAARGRAVPALVASVLHAAKNGKNIIWNSDLCGALEGIYDLKADELIRPLAEAGFTYDVVSKRCLFDTQ